MITDEEILAIAKEFTNYCRELDTFDFARAIYQLGRQHQRESDAELCEEFAGSSCYDVASDALIRAAEAILNNKDE